MSEQSESSRPEVAGPVWLQSLRRRAQGVEIALLVRIALVLGGIWLFAVMAEGLAGAEPHQLDRAILLALRDPNNLADPLGPLWVEEMMRDFTALGGTGVLVFITLSGVGYLLIRRAYYLAWVVLFTVLGAFLLTIVLKAGIARPRPDIVPRITYIASASFPSGHSSLSMATYIMLGALLARLQAHRVQRIYVLAVAMALALLVGLSRVYLGVHWPSDVLGGWVLGAVWGMIALLLAYWWQRRRAARRARQTEGDQQA